MRTAKKYLQLTMLLTVVAVTAVVPGLRNEAASSGPKLAPAVVSIDGIRLGMTVDEVESIKGAPTNREFGRDGETYIAFPDTLYSVRFVKNDDGDLAVDWVTGSVVGVGSRPILRPGEGDSVVLETLGSLGNPVYDRFEHCGFSTSLFTTLTSGYFDDLDGTLYYPTGLAVDVGGGEYRRATLTRVRPE